MADENPSSTETSVLLQQPTPQIVHSKPTVTPPKIEKSSFITSSSDGSSSTFLPQKSFSLSADIPSGIITTVDLKPPSPSLSPSQNEDSFDNQRTPRVRQPSSSSSCLVPPSDQLMHPFQLSSRPTSQTSLLSVASSVVSSQNSPLCTPKVRDFAYPRNHKYHALSFNSRRYSVSSRSSTSSDLESFFPQRIGPGGTSYVTDESWRQGPNVDPDEYVEVDGDEESVERRAVCVFDFAAECEGEISIETGQVVWVEFRKGVSGWLVVRDEITDSKGLVPEGYVRFLNEDEERQYLAQSPPTNTLLPREVAESSGEETPRQPTLSKQLKAESPGNADDDEWVDEPEEESTSPNVAGGNPNVD